MTGSAPGSLVVGVIDSGLHVGHPHIGPVAGGVGFAADGAASDDYVDRLGHGTAVAAAIQDLAPRAAIYALKVFDRALDAPVEALVAAIDHAAGRRLPLVNLSLGTRDPTHAGVLSAAIARADAAGTVVVAAGADGGTAWLPGTLDGVIRVENDWLVARGRCRVSGPPGARVFHTCGYPRPIPGVDPSRNLRGVSFAVAGITGLAARLMADPAVRGRDVLVAALSAAAG